MVLKWDRLGPDHEIDCSDDLTRLAFDTIGLCAFSYRFNEFYSDHAHPFAYVNLCTAMLSLDTRFATVESVTNCFVSILVSRWQRSCWKAARKLVERVSSNTSTRKTKSTDKTMYAQCMSSGKFAPILCTTILD